MKILIINNDTKYVDQLRASFPRHDVRTVRYRKHTRIDRQWADMFVLSGGSKSIMSKHFYKHEIQLIKTTEKPILGICLGLELIAEAYSVRLTRRRDKINGLRQIEIHPELFGIEGKQKFTVFEAHKWVVPKNSVLYTVGYSSVGAEIVKHPSRKIIGFQFHPEVSESLNDGSMLLGRAVEYLLEDLNNA